MNGNSRCYSHPDEVVVGVCPLCLNERLLVLATKRKQQSGRRQIPRRDPATRSGSFVDKKKQHGQQHHRPAAAAPHNIFAFGWLSFNRHWKFDSVTSYHDASSSTEDSFISIRFEDNGLGSWEKNAASKVYFENCKASSNQGLRKGTKETWNLGLRKGTKETWNLGLREGAKEKAAAGKEQHHLPGAKQSSGETNGAFEHAQPHASSRWRRWIGHLFQLIRLKRSGKGNACHVDGVHGRNGWIRTLTRKRTNET